MGDATVARAVFPVLPRRIKRRSIYFRPNAQRPLTVPSGAHSVAVAHSYQVDTRRSVSLLS